MMIEFDKKTLKLLDIANWNIPHHFNNDIVAYRKWWGEEKLKNKRN